MGLEVVGWPVVTAQVQLAKVGIQSPNPTYVAVPQAPVGSGDAPLKPPVKPGSVIAQQPLAGALVEQSTLVKLTVAQ